MQNIKRLFFLPKAVLRMDFDEMFRDVITDETNFTGQVLKTMVEGPKSGAEIAKELGISKGGRITGALLRLEESGFIAAADGVNPETGERPREKRYRLRDNYMRFYLKYVEPVKSVIDDGSFEFISLGQCWSTRASFRPSSPLTGISTRLFRFGNSWVCRNLAVG